MTSSVLKPIITFGALSDVQYADCHDRTASYDSSKTRFYRGALLHVDKAFQHWKESGQNVKFVLQLGDIIDGLNHSFGVSRAALRRTLEHFEKHLSIPTFHTVGNHELYNFSRKELAQLFYESVAKFNILPEIFHPVKPGSEESLFAAPILYYRFCPTPSVKCISLDCFDVSVLGYDSDSPRYQEAARLLSEKHGHDVFDDWDCDGPLTGLDVRFQQMNGAVGPEQLEWLNKQLEESDRLGQKVIVFGHVSLLPESTDWSCLLWNYSDVIETFHKHRCVVAYFSGHSHVSGYAVDSRGISYVVFTGIVEAPPESSAFATISLYHDHLEISGHGRESSYVIPFPEKQKEAPVEPDAVDLEVSTYSVKVEV